MFILDPDKSAPFKFTLINITFEIIASLIIDPLRSAPENFESTSVANEKLVCCRSVFLSFALVKFDSIRVASFK